MDNHRYASKFRTAQSTVLGEEHFKDLVRNGISVKLQPEQRSLLEYGDSYLLAVSEYLHQLNRVETICITFCLLGNFTSER